MKNNTKSIRDLAQDPLFNPKEACKSTIRNILISQKVHSFVLPRRIKDLSKQNVKDRKMFAKSHLYWTKPDWEMIIFTDECDLLPVYQGKEHIRLRENQKLIEVVPLSDHSKKLLTAKVWGIISCFGVGPLVKYEDTMDGKKYLEY